MTAFVGSLLGASDDTSTTTSQFASTVLTQWPDGWPVEDFFTDEASDAIAGPWTDNFPLKMPCNNYSGDVAHAYVRDYYNRIYCYPSQFNEYILVDTTVTFTMWNAYLYDVTCSDMNVTNPDEIQVQLFAGDVPFTILDLRIKTVDVLLPLDGSAQFTSTVTFDFGLTVGYVVVTITGLRVCVFSYAPLTGVVETLSYKTAVLSSANMSEQRMSVRDAPRQLLQYTVYLGDEQKQALFDATAYKWAKRLWGVPMWMQRETVSSIALGATTVSVDTTLADYRDGGFALVWQDELAYEVLRIDSVSTGGFTLEAAVASAWDDPVYVMPLRLAYANPIIERSSSPDGCGHLALTFCVQDNVRLTDYVPVQTHASLAVVTQASVVGADDLSVQMDAATDFVDYDAGLFEVNSMNDYALYVQSHRFVANTREDAWVLRQFFDYLHGRRVAFFAPTYKNDLVLNSPLSAAGTFFSVDTLGLENNMGVTEMRDNVAFVFSDGTVLTAKIVGIETVGSNDIITMDAPIGVTVNPGDCEVCFLDRVRLTSDDVVFRWSEPDYAVVEVELTRVRA